MANKSTIKYTAQTEFGEMSVFVGPNQKEPKVLVLYLFKNPKTGNLEPEPKWKYHSYSSQSSFSAIKQMTKSKTATGYAYNADSFKIYPLIKVDTK